MRQQNHLGVEREAVNGRSAENLQCRRSAEQFQAALRVGHFARDHPPDDFAESEGGRAAGQPPTGQIFGAVDVAGAEDHVAPSAADPFVALSHGVEPEGQIGVGEAEHPAGGVEHGGSHGPSLAALGHNAQRRTARAELRGQHGGSVGAAVVGDQHAIVDGPIVEERGQFLERPRQAFFFVIGRNDDRQIVVGRRNDPRRLGGLPARTVARTVAAIRHGVNDAHALPDTLEEAVESAAAGYRILATV